MVMIMVMMTVMMMTCLSELLNHRARAMEDLASGEWSLLFFRYSRFPQSVRLVSRHRTQIFGRFPRQLGKRRRNQILTHWASFSGFPIASVMIELHNDTVRENIGQAIHQESSWTPGQVVWSPVLEYLSHDNIDDDDSYGDDGDDDNFADGRSWVNSVDHPLTIHSITDQLVLHCTP